MIADRGNKERKLELSKKHKLCSYCKYHRGENAKKQPRRDRHKEHRK